MPRFHDNAVVLRRWDWSETSQVAWCFTQRHGLIRGVAKGAKRPKSAFDGGLEPLTAGELGVITKPDADLSTLTSWTLEEIGWDARTSLEANHAALLCAGLLASVVTDADPHPALYAALLAVIRGEGASPWIGVLGFQWIALVETGHTPRLASSPGNAAIEGFDPRAGSVVPDPGTHERELWRVRRETLDLLRAVAAGDPLPALDPERVARANRFLMSYWTWTLGREPRVARLLAPGRGPDRVRAGVRR